MVKVKLMQEFNSLAILLMNQVDKNGEKQFSVLAPEGAKFAP